MKPGAIQDVTLMNGLVFAPPNIGELTANLKVRLCEEFMHCVNVVISARRISTEAAVAAPMQATV